MKRTTELRSCDGRLRYEELFSSSGFLGPYSLLYRMNPSTRVERVEPVGAPDTADGDLHTVTNHLIDVDRVDATTGPFRRTTLVRNADFSYALSAPSDSSSFCRNAWGDELWVVVSGEGTLESEFGAIDYGPLDLVYVPRGTTWRIRSDVADQHMVVIESPSPIGPPTEYRNAAGQFTSHSLYTERDIRPPVLRDPVDEEGEFALDIKLGDRYVRAILPAHPFDVVGWDGAQYPYAINLRNVEPLSGRVWLTPDFHRVFCCDGLMICAITPNRTPDHPDRYPGQADHRTDCDEIFYRFAVPGAIVPGSGTITVHSRALAHGPKQGFEGATLPERTRMWGLILDAARPVSLTPAAVAASDESYVRAWV